MKLTIVSILFAVIFGGIGLGAAWATAAMIYDGIRAADWVLVKADVEKRMTYRYVFDGREYRSGRLGVDRLGGTDNLDEWNDRMAEYFDTARQARKPIVVWVNPNDPAEAVVDRDIRWALAALYTPFALGFGAIGAGAVWLLLTARRLDKQVKEAIAKRVPAPKTWYHPNPRRDLAIFWGVTLLWNGIALPWAVAFIPGIWDSGEWYARYASIIPLAGLILLWEACRLTYKHFRDGSRGAGKKAPPEPQHLSNRRRRHS